MPEFRYALVGDAVAMQPVQGPPVWRLSTQADRVKWLCQPGPFVLESADSQGIVLKRNRAFAGRPGSTPGNVDCVRFVSFKTQNEAVGALAKGDVHFVSAITDPQCVTIAKGAGLCLWQATRRLNLHYLGFRTDMKPFDKRDSRRQLIQSLDVPAALDAAGILEWRANGLLPSVPGDDLYRHESTNPVSLALRSDVSNARLLYNGIERMDALLAKEIERQIGVRLVSKDGYRQLVEAVQNGEGQMFLYNWYIREDRLARVLAPLCHSKSISHTNLTRYGDADQEIDDLLDNPLDPLHAKNAVDKILADAPLFVLYHAVRTAAWQCGVKGLNGNLSDPECNPKDKLFGVNI